jgi:RNA polymerase sigma factor (sigma-70 family)
MHAINDTECIRMILRGEKEYYAFLVEKYQDKAYNLCYKMMRNKEEARDCAQDAFIKAYEALPGFRIDSAFSTWFYRILYNTCISKIRKERHETSLIPDEPAWNHYNEVSEAVRNLDQEDTRELLQKAYVCLSSDEVFLVEQFYREECSIEEMAEMAGLSMSNVKVKLFRARQKMHAKIKSVLKEEIHVWQTR